MSVDEFSQMHSNYQRGDIRLRDVPAGEGFHFYSDVDKPTGAVAINLEDFAEKLTAASLVSIEFHFLRGDFERWLDEVVGDDMLSNRLRAVDRNERGEVLRASLVDIVEKRVDELKEIQLANRRRRII